MNKREMHNLEQQNLENLECLLFEGVNSGPATEMTREDWEGIMAMSKARYEENALKRQQQKQP
jgi:hypothetical protein